MNQIKIGYARRLTTGPIMIYTTIFKRSHIQSDLKFSK